jgi:hypothetical protein
MLSAAVASSPNRSSVGRILLAVATLAHMGGYLYAAPEHVVDPSWPAHARFHVLQALLWIVGFDLALLVLIFGPLARGDRGVRWVLLLAWLFVHGGYFVALLRGGGPPQVAAHVALLVVAVIYGVGLAWVWRGPGPDLGSASGAASRSPPA